MITLNSFLGRLPISTSLSCSSEVLSFSFICEIFLCCLILSNFLWSRFPFHSLQGCSSCCFCCLPPGGWGWSKRLVQASWWEGLVPAHWWVELGLVPLMRRAVSGGVFSRQLCGQENFKPPVCWWVGLCSHLVGLRWPSTGAYKLLGGARSWWKYGSLQEGSHQWVLLRTTPQWATAAPCLRRKPCNTSR